MQPTQTPDHTVVITPADTLRGAAMYLRRHGWHQRDMFDLSTPTPAFPPVCGLGGIRMALLGDAEIGADSWPPETVEAFDQAVIAFAEHLFAYYGEPDPAASTPSLDPHCVGSWPEQIVADWNDAYDRNVSQVIAALNGAADQWDGRYRTCWCDCSEEQDPPYCGEGATDPRGCTHCAVTHMSARWDDECPVAPRTMGVTG